MVECAVNVVTPIHSSSPSLQLLRPPYHVLMAKKARPAPTARRARRETELPEPSEVTEDGITDIEESEEVIPVRYSVTSYGADFLVDGIVTRLRTGDIRIPTFDPELETESGIEGFQRGFVWSKAQADGFIESLLLGLPVPGIFLVKEPSGVLLVLDGQQRLRTLLAFNDGVFRGQAFTLRFVQEQFRGSSYRTLDEEDRRRLDDSVIHATIVRQDDPSDDHSAIYLIFERLNTAGTQLQPQEIRVALYRGSLLRLLRELNLDQNWRALVGPVSPRLKDQELILRFLALHDEGETYSRPMIGFLNRYMSERRELNDDELEERRQIFLTTVAAVHEGVGSKAFRPATSVNAAVVDSVLVGVARRLNRGPIRDVASLRIAYQRLLATDSYVEAIQRATADEESVRTRLDAATGAFASVE